MLMELEDKEELEFLLSSDVNGAGLQVIVMYDLTALADPNVTRMIFLKSYRLKMYAFDKVVNK